MSLVNTNPVIGTVAWARHGDRSGFYQSPTTYTASGTAITALGEVQALQLGGMLRSIYANETSPNTITGLSTTTMIPEQLTSNVDGGGEGGVIFDSAMALWQGFYPPTLSNATISLANGSDVTSPLGGYQYLQINTVQPTDDVDFEGWINCPAWTTRTNAFYESAAFQAKAAEYAGFLASLAASGLVGDRNVTLANMYNIFDFINVQNIHNATFAAAVAAHGNSTMAIVRSLANYHEYGAFTDSGGGIGNVAGRTFLSRIIPALQDFATDNSTTKFVHYQVAYKPFLSLFNLTNVAGSGLFPNPEAMVDYASVGVFELRKNMAGTGHDVRFGFKNGTADGEAGGLEYYPLFGSDSIDTDLTTFVNNLNPLVLKDNEAWCNACNNTVGTECKLYINAAAGIAAANSTSSSTVTGQKVSSVGAGFIGACVTLALGAALLAALSFMGFVSFGKRRRYGNEAVPMRRNMQGSSFVSEDDK